MEWDPRDSMDYRIAFGASIGFGRNLSEVEGALLALPTVGQPELTYRGLDYATALQ
jgi:hypothetical protein